MKPLKMLYVFYDARCGVCSSAHRWLEAQPAHLPLRLLASDSPEGRALLSALPKGELTVISDAGDVWLGDHAFLVCLWALRRYRGWARRLASPLLRPLARQAFEAVSKNRRALSDWMGLVSEADLKRRLEEVNIPPCLLT